MNAHIIALFYKVDNFILARWIPAYAGMTNCRVIPAKAGIQVHGLWI